MANFPRDEKSKARTTIPSNSPRIRTISKVMMIVEEICMGHGATVIAGGIVTMVTSRNAATMAIADITTAKQGRLR